MKPLLIVCLALLSVFTAKGLHFLKDGFSLRRIQPMDTTVKAQWDDEVVYILEKPFHYLGRGRQCFAFESSDRNFVLKLPRTDIYKTPLWVRALPVSCYRKQLEKNHAKKMEFFLSSIEIASNELKDQSGVVMTHLGQSESGKRLLLIDALGCKHLLSLGKTSFILQKKWPLLTDVFLSALQKGEREEAKKVLSALVNAIEKNAQKGIFIKDPSFLRNYGFDGENARLIDIGTFYKKSDPSQCLQLINYSINPVRQWLAKVDPEMADSLLNKNIK